MGQGVRPRRGWGLEIELMMGVGIFQSYDENELNDESFVENNC